MPFTLSDRQLRALYGCDGGTLSVFDSPCAFSSLSPSIVAASVADTQQVQAGSIMSSSQQSQVDKQTDISNVPREVLEEELQIVHDHVPKIFDRLEGENAQLKETLQQKDAEIAALKAQLDAKEQQKTAELLEQL